MVVISAERFKTLKQVPANQQFGSGPTARNENESNGYAESTTEIIYYDNGDGPPPPHAALELRNAVRFAHDNRFRFSW